MRMKRVAFGIAAWLTLAVLPMPSTAQGRASQFATAPSQPSFLPTQAPAIATRVPFAKAAPGSSPIVIIQSQPVGTNPFIPGPNPVFTPGQPFLPDALALPAPVFPAIQQISPEMIDPVHILVPGQTAIPPAGTVGAASSMPIVPPVQAHFGQPPLPAPVSTPTVGTSRNDVLRRFGQPSVTVVTSNGETLYFNGGVTVRFENGQVIGAR